MTSARYEQLPAGMSSGGRDDGSSGDDEPSISPTQPEGQNAARLSMSSHSAGEQPENGHEKTARDEMKKTFPDQIKTIWGSIQQSLDDKPYEVTDSWGNIIWNLSKRLLTIAILLRYVLASVERFKKLT